jgi:hypothetical protein
MKTRVALGDSFVYGDSVLEDVLGDWVGGGERVRSAFHVFVYNFMPSLVVCQPSSVATPSALLVSSIMSSVPQ